MAGFESFMMRPKTNFLTVNVLSTFVLLLNTFTVKKLVLENALDGFMVNSKTSFLQGILHSNIVTKKLLCNMASKKLVLENVLDGFIKVRVDDKGVKWDTDMIDGHFNGSPISGYDINKEGFSNVGSITLDDPTQRDSLIKYLEDVEMPFMLERIGDKFTFWFFFKGVKSDVVFKLMRKA